MALKFNLWARIEVYDPETDEYSDLDSEVCEYKLLQTDDIRRLAGFIMRHQQSYGNMESGVQLEIEDALQRQGFSVLEEE